MLTAIELFFAGAWAAILHKGIGIAAIVVFLGLAFASQLLPAPLATLFAPLRKDLLWAAFGVALILGGEYIGARDEIARCKAQTVVIEHVTDKAVAKTETPAARAAKDKWDSEDN